MEKMKAKSDVRSYLFDPNDYKVINEINRGTFGIIYLVENTKDGTRYAAKVNLHCGSTEEQDKYIAREVGILIRVQSPTIVRFFGFSLHDFNKEPNITILMEYNQNESLRQLIEKESHNLAPHEYDNTAKQIILCGVAHGMMTLHSRRVIHRDLKPDNVLLDSHYHPCITDFGISKFVDPDNSKSQSMKKCGTPNYMAPEVVESTHYGPKADVYSFGILMFEVITGEFAYTELLKSKKHTFVSFGAKIIDGERPHFNTPIKPTLQQLIEQCWSADPKERPTFRELFNKLSLSLEDDDETIESTVKDIISDNEEEDSEFEYSRYCLEGVDYDKVIDYVDEITNRTSTSNEQHLKEIIESQSKVIKSNEDEIQQLKNQNENNQSEINQLSKENENNQKEIQTLQTKISELNECKSTLINNTGRDRLPPESEASKIDSLSAIDDISTIQNYTVGNPDGSLILEQIKEKIIRENLNEITIPSSVTTIGNSALSECSSLTQITIPSSVTSFSERALYRCKSLRQITIPSSVTSIGKEAFSECSSLTQITIPSSVTSIGFCAFNNCTKLEKIIVDPNNFEFSSIDGVLFTKDVQTILCYPNGKPDNNYTIPSTVTTIGDYAFSNSNSLTQITIPSSVISIGFRSFSKCNSLTQITIPSSVTSIGGYAFSNCLKLEKIFVDPKNSKFTSIDGVLFTIDNKTILCYPYKKPDNYTIPLSVQIIGGSAFYEISSLKKITIPSSVKIIEGGSFNGCTSLTQITIPSSVTSIRNNAFNNCINLEKIFVDPKNSEFTSIDGILFTKDVLTILCYPNRKMGNNYTIPSSVKIIGGNALSKCRSLTQITIPSTVMIIEEYAFNECSSLKEIKIPSSVKVIGQYAFCKCSSLEQIMIPSSVTSIGFSAFSECNELSSFIQNDLKKRYGQCIF